MLAPDRARRYTENMKHVPVYREAVEVPALPGLFVRPLESSLLEQARADAEAEVREMMSEAERQAAQATYHALEEASVQWEHKKEEARQRIPQAARWIVEKVVER